MCSRLLLTLSGGVGAWLGGFGFLWCGVGVLWWFLGFVFVWFESGLVCMGWCVAGWVWGLGFDDCCGLVGNWGW